MYLNVIDSGNGNRAVLGTTKVFCRFEAKGILDFCKVITSLGGKTLLVDLTSNLLNTSWYDSYNGLGTGLLAVKAAAC